jgi:hypothetical protein
MSQITIAMAAANLSEESRLTIESVLRQEFADFDFVVATGSEFIEFDDKRLQWNIFPFKNTACFYNATLDRSTSEFFATIEPGVVLFPGTLKRILCEFQKKPESVAIQSFYFQLDKNGQISRDQFRKNKQWLLETIGPEENFQDTLLINGVGSTGHFRVYRKSALTGIGGFSEKTNAVPDYEALLRISELKRIRIVAEHLYSWKMDKANTGWRRLRNWLRTLKYLLQRKRNRQNKNRRFKSSSKALPKHPASINFHATGSLF